MAEKKYVGKGRAVGQYGNVAFSVCVDDIQEHIFEYNGKRYVKLVVSKMREADKHGKTHTVSIDDFKPDPNKRRETTQTSQEAHHGASDHEADQINPEDIPF